MNGQAYKLFVEYYQQTAFGCDFLNKLKRVLWNIVSSRQNGPVRCSGC